jgi:hypothetical protein
MVASTPVDRSTSILKQPGSASRTISLLDHGVSGAEMSETAESGSAGPRGEINPPPRRRRRRHRRRGGGRRALIVIGLFGLVAVIVLIFIFSQIFSSLEL